MPRARARFTQRSASPHVPAAEPTPPGLERLPADVDPDRADAGVREPCRDRRPPLVGLAPRAMELHADGEPWLEAGRAGDSVCGNGDAPRQNKN